MGGNYYLLGFMTEIGFYCIKLIRQKGHSPNEFSDCIFLRFILALLWNQGGYMVLHKLFYGFNGDIFC